MDDFVASCNAAVEYPRNLIYHETYEHNLTSYEERLGRREDQLFSPDQSATLDLEEHDFQNHGMLICFESRLLLVWAPIADDD
jgi:hypothetical protein